ncbi:MAG: hypothetical protein N3A69_17855, partial [Leptospiraceae bacterium]|nr:hypothetical protein [Leptospiraceae bacterium]
ETDRISQLRHEIEKFKSRSGEDVDFEGYLAKLLKQMDKNRGFSSWNKGKWTKKNSRLCYNY